MRDIDATHTTPWYKPVKVTWVDTICPICGGSFRKESRKTNRRYCSDGCRVEAIDRQNRGDRWLIFYRDGFRCNYCGRSPMTSSDVSLKLDHVVPFSGGGLSTASNLITACAGCNGCKNALHMESTLELWILSIIADRNRRYRISPHKLIKELDNGRARPNGTALDVPSKQENASNHVSTA